MAFKPTQNLSTTFEQYPGYWLKFYTQSTTSPISMSIDSTGNTLLARAEISSGGAVPIGFIKTSGDSIFQPYLEEAYDAYIFPTASEADDNNISNAIQIANNINLS